MPPDMEPAPRLFQLFDLVTIINLPERKDRLRQMRQQLQRIGMDVRGTVELFPAIRAAEAAGFPTAGAHGCFLSHLGCIRRAIDAGARSLLILEDDVDFTRDFIATQEGVARQLDNGEWDFFYGGGNPEWIPGLTPSSAAVSGLRMVPSNIAINCAHFVGMCGSQLRGVAEYLAAMLARPVGHADGGPMDVDGAYSWYRMRMGARTLLAEPELGHQRSSASDIRPSWQDRIPLMRHALPLLRRGLHRRTTK